jgi:hypothetical protein
MRDPSGYYFAGCTRFQILIALLSAQETPWKCSFSLSPDGIFNEFAKQQESGIPRVPQHTRVHSREKFSSRRAFTFTLAQPTARLISLLNALGLNVSETLRIQDHAPAPVMMRCDERLIEKTFGLKADSHNRVKMFCLTIFQW